jgi:[acyl-carrier-protein] S-malonyltransferase
VPVISNVLGAAFESVEQIRDCMVRQVTESVRWVEDVQAMTGMGVQTFVECGPGKVLSGLVKRIDKEAAIYNIQDHVSLEAVLDKL